MSNNVEINNLLKRKEQYQKIYDEAVNTDLSFANEEKKYEVERTKSMYAQRIAKIDKDLEALKYKEQSEVTQVVAPSPAPPVIRSPQSQVIPAHPRIDDVDKRSAEEILSNILGPRYNQENINVPGKDFILCLSCRTHNESTLTSCVKCGLQIIKQNVQEKEFYVDIIEDQKTVKSTATILIEKVMPSQQKILEIIIGEYSLRHKKKLSASTVAIGAVKGAAKVLRGVTIYGGAPTHFIESGSAILVTTNEGIGIAKSITGCRSLLFFYRYWRDLPPIMVFMDRVMLIAYGFSFHPVLQTTEEYRVWKSQKKKVFSVKQKEERYKYEALKNRAFITRYIPIQIAKKRELLAEMENNPAFSDEQRAGLIESINTLVRQHQRWLKKKKDDPNTKVRLGARKI